MRGLSAGFAASLVALAMSGAGSSQAGEDAELPLPRWSPEELQAMRESPARPPLLGDLLGVADDLEELAATRPLLLGQGDENVGDSPEKSQPNADLSRFLLPSLLQASHAHPPAQLPTSPLSSVTEVTAEFLRDCEEAPASARLLDPNHELSETVMEDFERFLAFHATDSRIPLSLVVLGIHQKLPEGANLAAFASGTIAKGSSAVVITPYGDPRRTRIFVSLSMRNAVPADSLNSLLENGIRDALRATDPDEQLHRLLVQLSIRLFWIQRALPAVQEVRSEAPSPPPALEEVTATIPQARASQTGWLRTLTSGLLALLGLGLYTVWRWQRFKLHHFQWMLPVPEAQAPSQLGGQACGGAMALRYRQG